MLLKFKNLVHWKETLNWMCIGILGTCLVIAPALLIPELGEAQEEKVRPIPTQTVSEELRGSMQAKLDNAQGILNGLVMKDFESIREAATKMKKVSLTAPKKVEGDDIDNELYNHFKLEFLRLTTQLEKLAEEKNHEGTAFAYQNLTANCMACHSYLAGDE